jgi:hypothetical protein
MGAEPAGRKPCLPAVAIEGTVQSIKKENWQIQKITDEKKRAL